MSSPFPGMDPYLEQHWGDVHGSLVIYARNALNECLPSDLRARTQERVILEFPNREQGYYPDVRVADRSPRNGNGGVAVAPSDVAVAEPLEVVFMEPETQGYIEISESASPHRVVTVIEFLSPSNKYAGKGQDVYLQKQADLDEAGVSLVEIDLLRAGPHVLQLPLDQYPAAYRTPYKVCVHRAGKASAEIYKVPLRERLPAIRIPLRPTDADMPLDLQALIAQVYRDSRYDDTDYTIPPVPPLEGDDAVWADGMLRAADRRPAVG